MAEHRLVLPAHVMALLGVSAATASRRLRALEQGGLLSRDHLLRGYPPRYRIRRAGLEVIASGLPAPKATLNARHDVGVAWLWLAARSGTFGSLQEVISERMMRSHDAIEGHAARVTGRTEQEPFGVPLAGHGPAARPRLHYPDLLLVDRQGRRIAVELELSSKGRARRHRILGGYAANRRIDAVLYLVPDQRLAREVQAAARRFGCEPRVIVQPVRLGAGQVPDLGRGAERAGASGPERGSAPRRPAPRERADSTAEISV